MNAINHLVDSDSQPKPQTPRVHFVAPWSSSDAMTTNAQSSLSDAERHERMTRLAVLAIYSHVPWLASVLETEGGSVVVTQGHFYFALPTHPNTWHEVPELSACLSMLPWAEDGEQAH